MMLFIMVIYALICFVAIAGLGMAVLGTGTGALITFALYRQKRATPKYRLRKVWNGQVNSMQRMYVPTKRRPTLSIILSIICALSLVVSVVAIPRLAADLGAVFYTMGSDTLTAEEQDENRTRVMEYLTAKYEFTPTVLKATQQRSSSGGPFVTRGHTIGVYYQLEYNNQTFNCYCPVEGSPADDYQKETIISDYKKLLENTLGADALAFNISYSDVSFDDYYISARYDTDVAAFLFGKDNENLRVDGFALHIEGKDEYKRIAALIDTLETRRALYGKNPAWGLGDGLTASDSDSFLSAALLFWQSEEQYLQALAKMNNGAPNFTGVLYGTPVKRRSFEELYPSLEALVYWQSANTLSTSVEMSTR